MSSLRTSICLGLGGMGLIERIAQDERLSEVPIIILTSETKEFDFSRADLIMESAAELVALLEEILPE